LEKNQNKKRRNTKRDIGEKREKRGKGGTRARTGGPIRGTRPVMSTNKLHHLWFNKSKNLRHRGGGGKRNVSNDITWHSRKMFAPSRGRKDGRDKRENGPAI